MNSPQPTDAVLEAMVDRVEGELLAPRRHSRQHKTRLRIAGAVGAGVLLLGAGLSVTAAVAFPQAPTVPETQVIEPNGTIDPNDTTLTIQCLNPGTSGGFFVFGHGGGAGKPVPGEAAARANPASECPQQSTDAAITSAVSAQAASRIAKGAKCGTDVINQSDDQVTWRRSVDADGQVTVTQTRSNAGDYPTDGCLPLVNLTVPAGPSVPLAVCAIDAKDAAVFARGNETASDYCNSLGEEVWKG